MPDDVMQLFDDYAARFARGERPDVRAYLARAGEGADELGRLIDRYLEVAPAREPDAEAVETARAWVQGEPPILDLRRRRRLRRDEVVDALIGALGLDVAKRAKVKRYYAELETGQLDARRVDQRLLRALASLLRARAGELLTWRSRPAETTFAYFRLDAELPAGAAAAPSAPRIAEPDEIDELFGVGGSDARSE